MNVLIVDDSELVRFQLARILGMEPRIKILGECSDEASAVEYIVKLNPDVVLLDLSLSPGSGLGVLKSIRANGCGCRVIVLTNNTDQAIQDHCAALGVSGFFDKTNQADEWMVKILEWLPPVPSNEDIRLQALQETRLLDSPEDEVFDDIARLAREITGAPIALISLIDKDRQWFLSHQGLECRETSRSVAFCARTILNNQVMEVHDALNDRLFKDNPLVVGAPHIRYYLGVPLVLASGEAIGSLCVCDVVARELGAQQLDAMKTLGRSVIGEIELRRKLLKLEQEVLRRAVAERQMAQLAMRDPLTQLHNRTALLDRLDQQIRNAARHQEKLAFLFVDLDRFKLINDTLGHEVGDGALLEVAARVPAVLRDSDTVARLGGDEFAVLLPAVGDVEAAKGIARKIGKALRQPALVKGHRLHLDASIGIALYPDHGTDAESLMRRADLAIYQAKQSEDGEPHVYEQSLDDTARSMLSLENDLRDALDNDEIIAYYQPQVSLGKGGLCGVEALARWKHPRLGLLGPGEFIEFAERRGFIHRIGLRMLDLAVAQTVAWERNGTYVPRIAVNVSSSELHESFVFEVEFILKKHGLAYERLEIETTESTLASDNSAAVGTLRTLRRKGIHIAVDDFGVGYSSLGQLRRLPIDTLKIDKTFVDEVQSNGHDAAIVSAVITMARSLGLRTLAEGADSEQQMKVLRELGCENVQGYCIAKPLAPEDFERWLLQKEPCRLPL